MIWISKILTLFKYWKTGGVILLAAAFLMASGLAHSRGEKMHVAEKAIEAMQQKITHMEKVMQDERERQDFKTRQDKKIGRTRGAVVEFAPSLRDAYDLLRKRQAGRK